MIEAGKLNKRVTILYCERHDDDAGGSTTTWGEGGTVWAEVLPTRSGEKIAALAVESGVTHKVRIRKQAAPSLEPEDRLRYNGRELHVVALSDYGERGEFYEILAEERRR